MERRSISQLKKISPSIYLLVKNGLPKREYQEPLSAYSARIAEHLTYLGIGYRRDPNAPEEDTGHANMSAEDFRDLISEQLPEESSTDAGMNEALGEIQKGIQMANPYAGGRHFKWTDEKLAEYILSHAVGGRVELRVLAAADVNAFNALHRRAKAAGKDIKDIVKEVAGVELIENADTDWSDEELKSFILPHAVRGYV